MPRLVVGMTSAALAKYIAFLTPMQILLTVHLTQIAGDGAAAAFGFITGAGGFVALVANPLGGRISDRTAARFGRRRTWILAGGLTASITLVAISYTTAVWQVAAIWCLFQIGICFQLAATTALLADQVPLNRRGSVSGILGTAGAVGPMIGLAGVSMIPDPTAQWWAVAAAAAILSVVAVVLIRERPTPQTDGTRISLPELARSFWINPAKHPAFGWAWLVRFLVTCGFASGTYSALFLMDRFGITTDELAKYILALALLPVVLIAITSLAAGWLSDRWQRQKPFVMVGALLVAAALTVQGLSTSFGQVVAATALLGIGTGLFFAVDNAMGVRVLPDQDNAAKDLAVFNMAGTITQSFVPFIAPLLLAIGGFTALYLFLAALGVAGALAVTRIPEVGHEGDPRWAAITTTPTTT